MTSIQSFLAVFFGTSWKTSLLGYLGAAGIEVANQMSASPQLGWHVAALFLLAICRAAKDSDVTGGSKPATDEAAARLFTAAIQAPPKGFARIGLLLVLAILVLVVTLSGCAGVSALTGSTGPITITTAKDPVSGATVSTSTVTLTAGKAALSGDTCWKPVTAEFNTLAGQHDTCSVTVPLKAVDGACP